MPGIRERLEEAAASPSHPLDVEWIRRRGLWRRGIQGVVTGGLALALILVGSLAGAFDQEGEPRPAGECEVGRRELAVYLKPFASDSDVAAIASYLAGREGVRRVTYVSKDQALAEFIEQYPDAQYGSIPQDALPASFRVEIEGLGATTFVEDLSWFQAVDAVRVSPPLAERRSDCD